MSGYLLSPIASQPGGGVAFSVLTYDVEVIEAMAEAIYDHDSCGDNWAAAEPLSREEHLSAARAALAAYRAHERS